MVSLPDGLHGAFRRCELSRLVGQEQVRAAIQDGSLVRFAHGVVVDGRKRLNLMTRTAAALLLAGPDSVLFGFTALALHGCSAAAATAPVHVLVPYARKLAKRPGIVVHQGVIGEHEVQEIAGLRAMILDVAVAEVLCRGDRWDALACADQAFASMPEADRPEFRATIEANVLGRRDSRGRRRARVLLELASGRPESPPESWILLVLTDGGLPVPICQHPVVDLWGRELYRLDFAWPELRIAVEYDGYEAHEGREDRDAAREEDLRRRGWTIIRATSADLRNPGRLIAEVKAAFMTRGLAA